MAITKILRSDYHRGKYSFDFGQKGSYTQEDNIFVTENLKLIIKLTKLVRHVYMQANEVGCYIDFLNGKDVTNTIRRRSGKL